jgi:serine/threonine protein kinase
MELRNKKNQKKLTINSNKFINIESHHEYNISIALSINGIYYIWGKSGESEKLKAPKETKLKSFNDIFFHYYEITHKTLNFLNTINLRVLKNGKYEKEFFEQCLIGSGLTGIVYKAIDRNDGKVYAIKKTALEDLERIPKKLGILFKLKGDFVVKFINFWAENNYQKYKKYEDIYYLHPVFDPRKTILLHIQMELCFKTLEEILYGELRKLLMTPLGYYISSELFVELLECVNYLHKHNIIHRHLKPSKILITYGLDGRFIKLGEFIGPDSFEICDCSTICHCTYTLRYMAPETLSGRKYDTRADIYSLGVIAGQLFNFDINKQNVKQGKSMLEMKFSSLEELYSRMISTERKYRPYCDEILSQKESWTLSTTANKDIIFEQIEILPKDSFEYYFINAKCKCQKERHEPK